MAEPELSHDYYRKVLAGIAQLGNEYAGLPMPIDGEHLVINPKYRFAHVYKREPEPDEDEFTVINSWWSLSRSRRFMMWREKDGKIGFGWDRMVNHARIQLHTLGCAIAWTQEAEMKAMLKLASLVEPHTFHQYFSTGSFLETSKRSKVMYCFRRLRPTLAISMSGNTPRILCALCLHPIGYYDGTWAGAMCPTDEVIAHLMLMRGDEHDFWKQANQHPAWHPQAGV